MARGDLIPGRKHAPQHLGRVLVLGLGKSGRAAVEYLLPLLGGRVDALAVAAGARTEAAEAFAAEAAARGALVVDEGAKAALVGRGSSLLSVGVSAVEGRFEAGDVVDIKDGSGHLFARGKAAFSCDEAALAIGRTRAELQANRLLASLADKPLVHRDELIVFE